MRILILGGTVFLGRHLVEAARARGHGVTIFHRGRSNPGLFSDVEVLFGDRDGGLGVLSGRRWDVVIDTSGYVPRIVRASARRLADAVAHYTFISSGSVYAAGGEGPDESSPVETIEDEASENVPEHYGALKALCEQAIEETLPGRLLAVRAGLLVGPHDPTERFTYWPRRITRGGDVLAPGRPERPVQLIDARDLAEWTITMAEARRVGVFNATGPERGLSMQGLLEACRMGAGQGGDRSFGRHQGVTHHGTVESTPELRKRDAVSTRKDNASFVWVEESFLFERGVEPWMDLPLWLPERMNGMMAMSIERALDAGLVYRPLEETTRDTLEWDQSRPEDLRGKPTRMSGGIQKQPGLTPEREGELLSEWRSMQS